MGDCGNIVRFEVRFMRRNLKFLKIEHPVDKRIFVSNVGWYYIILVEYFSKKMVYLREHFKICKLFVIFENWTYCDINLFRLKNVIKINNIFV